MQLQNQEYEKMVTASKQTHMHQYLILSTCFECIWLCLI